MSEELCVDFGTGIEERDAYYNTGKSRDYRTGEKNQGYKEDKKSNRTEPFKIGYRRDLHTSYFIVETDRFYQPDYQMKMLACNEIPGILRVKGRGVNGKSRYEYEIQGKHSLEFMTQKNPVTYEMIMELIRYLMDTMEEMRDYLLNPNQLLLDPRSIFCENGRYFFCYYPPNEQGIAESFHELTEFFVRETDYRDRSGIYIAYALHKMTLTENYQIRQVIGEILKNQEESREEEETKEEWEEEEHEEEYEYGENEEGEYEEEPEKNMGKERVTGWGIFKNLLHKRKKDYEDDILTEKY